jgi:hypothetical protein
MKKEFDRDKFFKFVEDSTKDIMRKKGDITPQFFVITKKEEIAMVVMLMDNNKKDDAVDALRKITEQMGSELYYSAMTGWCVNPDEVKKMLNEDFKKYIDGKMSMDELMQHSSALQERPTLNPARKEVVTLVEYSKTDGMRMKLIRVKREKEDGESKIIGFEEFLDDKKTKEDAEKGCATMYSRFNVWKPTQVDMVERDEHK